MPPFHSTRLTVRFLVRWARFPFHLYRMDRTGGPPCNRPEPLLLSMIKRAAAAGARHRIPDYLLSLIF